MPELLTRDATELRPRVFDVRLCGIKRGVAQLGNAPIGDAVTNEVDDLALGRGQNVGVGWTSSPCHGGHHSNRQRELRSPR